MTGFHLGKHPAKHDQRTLQFATYTRANLPVPPAQASWTGRIPEKGWGMMGNDTHSDCTCAAAGHLIRSWTASQGHEVVVADPTVLAFYGHFAGANPHAGADLLAVLRYWRKTGLDGHAISAFVALALRNERQLKEAVNLFGGAYIGLGLPAFVSGPGIRPLDVIWDVPAKGAVGEAAVDSAHGHCVCVVGYDAEHVYAVTWGVLKAMTWRFYLDYTEEAFAVLSPDWFGREAGAKAPSGFDFEALDRDLRAVSKI